MRVALGTINLNGTMPILAGKVEHPDAGGAPAFQLLLQGAAATDVSSSVKEPSPCTPTSVSRPWLQAQRSPEQKIATGLHLTLSSAAATVQVEVGQSAASAEDLPIVTKGEAFKNPLPDTIEDKPAKVKAIAPDPTSGTPLPCLQPRTPGSPNLVNSALADPPPACAPCIPAARAGSVSPPKIKRSEAKTQSIADTTPAAALSPSPAPAGQQTASMALPVTQLAPSALVPDVPSPIANVPNKALPVRLSVATNESSQPQAKPEHPPDIAEPVSISAPHTQSHATELNSKSASPPNEESPISAPLVSGLSHTMTSTAVSASPGLPVVRDVPNLDAKSATLASEAAEAAGTASTPADAPIALMATPSVLEVGVASATHGWLRVRAEFGQQGSVTASVSAATPAAAESLHRELPAISAFLASEHLGVTSLVVHSVPTTESSHVAAGASDIQLQETGSDGGSGFLDDRSSRQGRGRSDPPNAGAATPGDLGELAVDLGASLGAATASQSGITGAGGWLSVRV